MKIEMHATLNIKYYLKKQSIFKHIIKFFTLIIFLIILFIF